MLTIKDILHIPYPEEQKELKPGYTVLDLISGETYVLNYANFESNCVNVDGYSYLLDGTQAIFTDRITPLLIVIDVPKVPKKIRLAPALLKSQNIYKSQRLYESFEEAKLNNKDTSVIWPAPLIGPDGFYEFSGEDWK